MTGLPTGSLNISVRAIGRSIDAPPRIAHAVAGQTLELPRMATFKWVNTTLGNIKSAITGTYRKLGPDRSISLGQAARFSGLAIAEFTRHVSQLGIPVVQGTAATVDEDTEAVAGWRHGSPPQADEQKGPYGVSGAGSPR